ncbi:unnamed protein product [Lymnaea stagnalis]|uniref:VWFD domain-containing protein n=1 Tax=Lymnaea stagnalis TaxID=6523 RepID=A0AAV2IDJ1_LYMST
MTTSYFFTVCIFVSVAQLTPGAVADCNNTCDCNNCGFNTVCVNGSCQCKANYTGNPYFHCYDVDNLYCSISSDPRVRPFNGPSYNANIMGSTRMASLRTTRSDANQSCELTLFTYTERVEGKLYVKDAQYQIKVPSPSNPTRNSSLVVQITAVKRNNVTTWTIKNNLQGFIPQIITGNFTVTVFNCRIQYYLCPSRLLAINISCCGIFIGFRPFMTKDTKDMPGIFVEVESANKPLFDTWEPTNEPLCLGSEFFDILRVMNVTGISDPTKAGTYLALTNGLPASGGEPENQPQTSADLKFCNAARRLLVLDYEWFALSDAKLINCVSVNEGLDDLFLFIRWILNWRCTNSVLRCNDAKNQILTNCGPNVINQPAVSDFLNRNCSSPQN